MAEESRNEWKSLHYDDGSVPIVTATEGQDGRKKYSLNKDGLESMLNNNRLKDIPIVIVSIVGPMRKGKSLLLQLIATYYKTEGWLKQDWLSAWKLSNDDNMPLSSPGADPYSQGLIAYGAPTILERSDGKQIAVLLIDSEGLFDHANTKENDSGLFTFCSYMSSLLIFNTPKFDGNDLETLKFLIDIARDESIDGNTFNDMLVILRDWNHPRSYPYGDGGRPFYGDLQKKLALGNRKIIAESIRKSFNEVYCYLLPEPEKCVRNQVSDKPLTASDLGDDFCTYVKKFTELYLHPENLYSSYADKLSTRVDAAHYLALAKKYGDSIIKGDITSISRDPVYRKIRRFRRGVKEDLEALVDPDWSDYDDITDTHKVRLEKEASDTFMESEIKQFNELMDLELTGFQVMFQKMRRARNDKIISEAKEKLKKRRGKWITKTQTLRDLGDGYLAQLKLDERDMTGLTEQLEKLVKENVEEARTKNAKVIAGGVAVGLAAGGITAVTAGLGLFLGAALAGEIAICAAAASGTAVAAGVEGVVFANARDGGENDGNVPPADDAVGCEEAVGSSNDGQSVNDDDQFDATVYNSNQCEN